eukprot:747661-Hanusia_phi.AAC.3
MKTEKQKRREQEGRREREGGVRKRREEKVPHSQRLPVAACLPCLAVLEHLAQADETRRIYALQDCEEGNGIGEETQICIGAGRGRGGGGLEQERRQGASWRGDEKGISQISEREGEERRREEDRLR